MSIITDVNREPEIISKKSPEKNKMAIVQRNGQKGQCALLATQFYADWIENSFRGKGLSRLGPFQGQ